MVFPRFAASALLLCGLMAAAPLASAHPHDHEPDQKPVTKYDSNRPIAEQIKLPTQEELDEIWAQMPDFNALFGDMQKVWQDPNVRAGMENSMGMMKSRMAEPMSRRDENGMPDFNAMMKGMFGLMGEEEFMAGFFGMITPMQEVMEKHAPDTPRSGGEPEDLSRQLPQ